jgi:DNA polymerase delta subunit 1
MMAHNLCYSTIIPAYRIKEYSDNEVNKTPQGDYFIKKEVCKGVLPIILEELVSQRKRVKELLKNCKDPQDLIILDSR